MSNKMEDKKNMRFHITITDNETGGTLHDCDVCAIIGAFKEEGRTGCVCLSECNSLDLAMTIDGVMGIVQHVYNAAPPIKPLVELAQVITQKTKEDK